MSYRVFAVLALASACATPYQAGGLRGGYSDEALGKGRHKIVVNVNGYTSSATAREYFERRARELCPKGYVVESGWVDQGETTTPVYDARSKTWSNQAVSKPEVSGVVKCNTPIADRKRYAKEMNAPALAAQGLVIAADGHEATDLVITAPVCGVPPGLLVAIATATINEMRHLGFKRLLCTGGVKDENYEL